MGKKTVLKIGLLIFSISFLLNIINSWGISIFSLDEAKNAECAREMLERGDLIVPTFNYELRTDKPPLHYYFMMLGYKLFGINEFSARFFSAVFGALTVLLTFFVAYKNLGLRTALFSSIILLSSIHLAIQFHMAVPDPYLVFFINASLFSFFYGFENNKRLYLYLFYILSGFGILSKGPVAIVLPLAIIFIYLFFTGRLREWRRIRLFSGLILTLLVALPWYIAVYIATDGIWIKEFILKHNIHRFSSAMEGHGGIFLITFLFVFIGLLPFSVFIFHGLIHGFKNRRNDFILFNLIFALVYITFFSISQTKLPNYTVPAYFPLSILIGQYLADRLNITRLKYLSIPIVIYTLLAVALTIGLYFAIKNEEPISDLSHLAYGFGILVISGLISLAILYKNRLYAILTLSIGAVITIVLFFTFMFPPIDKRNSVQQILKVMDKERDTYYYRRFNPAFVFYLRKRIPPLEKKDIPKKSNIYILSRKKYLKELKNIPNLYLIIERKDLFENHISVLLEKK